MTLQIQNFSQVPVPRQFITGWMARLGRELKRKRIRGARRQSGELVIVFVDPPRMRRLNKQFRSRNYATDILSFEPLEPHALGELILCPQVLRRQAAEQGWSFREELGYMLTHGVLHLLGYDHETSERDAGQMFTLQDRLFEIVSQTT